MCSFKISDLECLKEQLMFIFPKPAVFRLCGLDMGKSNMPGSRKSKLVLTIWEKMLGLLHVVWIFVYQENNIRTL